MFLLAWISYRFVETPLRRAKSAASKVGFATLFLAGLALGAQNFDYQEDLANFKPTQWAGNLYRVNPRSASSEGVDERMKGIEVLQKTPAAEDTYAGAYLEKGIVLEYSGSDKIEVLVLGDSHGLQWAPVIDEIMHEIGKTVSFMTADGTPAFFNIPVQPDAQRGFLFTSEQLTEFKQARLRVIRERKPELVIISAAWRESHIKESEDVISEILKSGAQILFIGDPPRLEIGDRNAPQYLSYLGVQNNERGDVWLDLLDSEHYQEAKITVKSIVDRCESNCRLVEPGPIYIRSSKDEGGWLLKVIDNEEVLYIDDDHLSVAGATLSKELIQKGVLAAFAEHDVKMANLNEVNNASESPE